MRTLFWLTACGSEQQIIDPNSECDRDGIAQGTVTYELSCPEIPACPAVDLACPEVEIPACPDVEVTCPEPQITVEAPSVTVEPAEVNVTNDFADLVLAIEDLALNTSSGGNATWAHLGYTMSMTSVWTNNTTSTAVLVTAAIHSGCDIYDATGTLQLNDICDSSRCNVSPSWSPGVTGSLQIPIEPGGWIDCSQNSNQWSFYLGGYYQ